MNKLVAAWRASFIRHIKQYGLSTRLMLTLVVMIAVLLIIFIWAAWQLVVLYAEDSTHKSDHSSGYQESPVKELKLDIHAKYLSANDPALLKHYGAACFWSEDFPVPLIPVIERNWGGTQNKY